MIFPLYAMRDYLSITYEGKYKCINTYKSRYVLDYAEPTDIAYNKRRILLLGEEDLPYKLYPLKLRIENHSQIINSGKKLFIDNTGALKEWKPQKFFPIVSHRIRDRFVNKRGYTLMMVKGCPNKFKIYEDIGYTHLSLIHKGSERILYEPTIGETNKQRKKL